MVRSGLRLHPTDRAGLPLSWRFVPQLSPSQPVAPRRSTAMPGGDGDTGGESRPRQSPPVQAIIDLSKLTSLGQVLVDVGLFISRSFRWHCRYAGHLSIRVPLLTDSSRNSTRADLFELHGCQPRIMARDFIVGPSSAMRDRVRCDLHVASCRFAASPRSTDDYATSSDVSAR